MWIFLLKMAVILQNLLQLGQTYALGCGTTQGMCMQNIIGISVIMRALELVQRFANTVWILRQWRLQCCQKQIGPTLHVGPNNAVF